MAAFARAGRHARRCRVHLELDRGRMPRSSRRDVAAEDAHVFGVCLASASSWQVAADVQALRHREREHQADAAEQLWKLTQVSVLKL